MSNGASGLALLAQERDNILLAQVSALLHDIGKFCNRHYEAHSLESQGLTPMPDFAYKVIVDDPGSVVSLHGSPQPNDSGIYNELASLLGIVADKAADYLEPAQKAALLNTQISLHSATYSLAEIIILARPRFARPSILNAYLGKNAWTIATLGACHREAHHDKQEPQGGHQSINNVLVSTPFGFEDSTVQVNNQPGNLTSRLKSLPFDILKSYKTITGVLEQELNLGLGDTRRPINEVDLWSWSSSVEALFKAMIASSLLTSPLADLRQVSWRLLHITFDGLSFLEQAPTIGDLVGRQVALQAALDDVRQLLEVTYPLGNEVYRDENGSAFVVPALDGDDADGNRLRGLIESHILDMLQQSELDGELRPRIHITKPHEQAAVLHEALGTPPPPVTPFQENLQEWWANDVADICTACGVRPQGWGAPNDNQKRKAQARNVCYVCLKRRGKRAQEWAQARHKSGGERKPWERTIWLDEVADENGRLALVVCKFDLTQWLNGNMVQTLLVVCDPANNQYESKNPSFARLQRVWRTTQQFWRTVQDVDIPAVARLEQRRLSILVSNAGDLKKKLGDYHAYEAEINGRRLSVIWDSKDECLLTADNLAAWMQGGTDALCAQLQPGTVITLFEPGGYGQRPQEQVTATVTRTDIIPVNYSPTIALLTQPASFMALIPAAVALEIVTKIARRYELEMNKVHNRLPLFLGLIFFDRRQPLFSALDAGRRLLKTPLAPVECTVTCNCARSRENDDAIPTHLSHPHFKQWQELRLTTPEGQSLHWRASTIMGDGNTPDDWYPYVNVVRGVDGNPPIGRKQFKFKYKGKDQQWVHVSQVQNGDTISFTPSRFTWLFLDTSARRFEAGEKAYPHPLEELARITELWQKLKDLAAANKLSESQLQAIVALLATKRESWGINAAEYDQLAQAILHKEGLEMVAKEDLTSGRLQAAFELHHRILKQRLKEEAA